MSFTTSPISAGSSSSSSCIHSKERNPVRKIPLIHRILSFAASDVLQAEQLSTTCSDWRESVEVYGSGLFARFASQEPDEYFRYFYELVEWGQGTWMLEHMIVGWNKLAHIDEAIFAADSNVARENRQQFYAANMGGDEIDDLTLSSYELKKIRQNASMSRKATAENDERGEANEQKSKEITQFQDFFNNEYMDRCIRLYGGTKPCVVAARHNRHDVLRLLYKYGADLEDSFLIPGGETSAIEAAIRHRSIHSLVVLCQVKAIREIEEEIYCLVNDQMDMRKPRTARRTRIAEANRVFKEKRPDEDIYVVGDDRGETIADISAFTTWDLTATFDVGSTRNVEFLQFLKSLDLVVDDGNLDLNLPWKLKERLAEIQKQRGMFREKTEEESEFPDTRSEESKLRNNVEILVLFCKTKVPSYNNPEGFTYAHAADVTWAGATDGTDATWADGTDATWE